MNYIRRLFLSFIIYHLSFSVSATDTQKPWTFWYWMYGAVSEAGIRADLQAMKDVGLGGCYLMPIRAAAERPEFGGDADAMSDCFWRLVDLSLEQADSLGLDMGIHVCDGFALAGGPWISPAESMQKVVWTDTIVNGGHQQFLMPKPAHYQEYYEDIAVYAIPVHNSEFIVHSSEPRVQSSDFRVRSSESRVQSSESRVLSSEPRVQRSSAQPNYELSTMNCELKNGVFRADQPCWLQMAFDEPTLVRAVEIEPSGTNIQSQRLLVKASDDGVIFYPVKQLTPPRQGWQNTGYATTFSIPPTRARYFRFEWTPEGTEPGAEDLDAAKWKPVLRLKSIRLHSLPTIDNWEGKAGYVWRIAPDTPREDLPSSDCIYASDLIYSTMQGDSVDMRLPEGTWRILRMGHTSTGHTNATAGGAKGLECDKFSAEAVEKQVDSWFGRFMQRPNHRAIKFLHVDSWECGSQNWSRTFADEFSRRRGYNIISVLPVYAGVPLHDADQILRDVRQTINDLVNDVFFATVERKAWEYGVRLSSESVAPTMVSDGMEHYKYVSMPMGEYWLNSPTHDKPTDMLDAISAAHVYGKTIVQAEGFTEVRGVWDETPASIKPLLDRNFALGMNRLFFHVNTHNPWTDRRPGMTLDGIGLFFQRDQTWFPEARGLVDYITRCQQYLQRGTPIVDIAVFTGDEMPRRALTPDRLVGMLPGLFGTARVASERERLANHGLPMIESPVGVRHSAGILDLKDWVNPLHGYHYDSMNPDGLTRWLRKLHDPSDFDMPRYRVLVVPRGMRVSDRSQRLIDSLRHYGIGIISEPIVDATLPDIQPDAILPEGIAFAHRHDGHGHCYFLSNQTDSVRTFRAKFRIGHQGDTHVCLYDPLSDKSTNAESRREGDYLCCDIRLDRYGSLFVLTGSLSAGDAAAALPVHSVTKPLGEQLTWKVKFVENGAEVTTRQLFDWSRHHDDRIRYYSGRARYSTTVRLDKSTLPAGTVRMALPGVKDVAHVWVNGKDCGIAWTPPYEVDITGALRKGKNHIVIEVVNTWHNALRGADQGKSPYDGIWTNARYRTKGDDLLPAGLLVQPELKTEQ